MRFRIKYQLPNGKLFIDKLIFAKDDHDGIRVASDQFEYYFNKAQRHGMSFNTSLQVREGKLIINEE